MTGGPGRLVLVGTPIGNLGELTPRAIETLRAAALVCCEDTRRTGRLLVHAGVKVARLAVCNEHTERSRIADVLAVLAEGGDVAVVTDAGMPAISDPGERLVKAVIDAGHEVSVVSGPSAVIGALVVSGLPTSRFVFEGFLPRGGRDRGDRLAAIAAERRTTVLYEAPSRVGRTIADLVEHCGGDRRVAVVRELTKLYETVLRGRLGDIDVSDPRGEYVIVVEGMADDRAVPDDDTVRHALRQEFAAGASTKDAAAAVAHRLGVPKRSAYALALGTDSRPGDPATADRSE